MKYNLACGPLPLHQQHLDYMGDLSEWTLVDLYCKHPSIKNWDATKLDEIPDGSASELYSSHFLEHVPHGQVKDVLSLWHRKLKEGGKLYLNVPNLEKVFKLIIRYEEFDLLDGYYHDFEGEHGILSIIYGNQAHEGEFHKSGYTRRYITYLLEGIGFEIRSLRSEFEAHDMECLIVEAYK